MSTSLDIKSNISDRIYVDIRKDYVLRIFYSQISSKIFILKFLFSNEKLLVLLAEAKLVVLSGTLLLKLHNQFDLRACEKCLINRTVPLLFKCNLLLLRQEPSISLLFMNLIPLPLHKFSNFLLISLISSSKS